MRIESKCTNTHPIRRGVFRDVKKSRGIGHVDADPGFLREWPTYGVEQGFSEAAMSGSIYYEICVQRFAPPIGVLTSDRRDRRVARARDELLCSATLAYLHIATFPKPFTHGEFKQWPRQAVDRDAEIPLGKRVISRELYAIVVTHAKPHSAGLRKTLHKTGE